MKDTDFYQCSKEDLLIAAKESQNSAQSLFETAKNAASNHRFGLANSLVILSVEECIKSAILLAGYFSIKLEFDVEPYFKDHKAKHDQAAEIQPLINIVCKIRDVYSDILKNRQSAHGTIFKLVLTHLAATIGVHIGVEPKDFTKWWNEANKFKKNGFYVGFYDGKWTFPSSVDENSYKEALAMTRPFVECLQIVHDLRPNDYLELSFDRKFTTEEIQQSEIRLIPIDSGGEISFDFSEYQPVNKNETQIDNASSDELT